MVKPADGMHVATTSPIQDAKEVAKLLRRDTFFVRWFNYSPLAHMTAKINCRPPVRTFLLITKGRRSGKWIDLPIYYFRDGENYYVIGSSQGDPRPPKWFLNLSEDPHCKIHVNWRTRAVRARTATGVERERLWQKAVRAFPNYNDYARTAAPREIPVVVLENYDVRGTSSV
jgi:deazaflavin-dependent oxidoreductase (nitroreductase family)